MERWKSGMKIALLVQRFPHGGAESYVEEIAKRLHAKGQDVTVITSESDNNDSQYGFRIIRLPSRISLGEYSFWKNLDKILQQEKFDLVHTNTYGYFHSDKAAALKKKLGYKLVMTSHGFAGMNMRDLKKRGEIKKGTKFDFIRPFYDTYVGKKTLKRCDQLIALSKKDAEFYTELGIEQSKVTIIPPGIKDEFFVQSDVKDFKKNLDGNPILLCVGEISLVKNHSLLVKAMPYILEKNPNAKLFVIGRDAGELENLTALCNKLKLGEKVVFAGAKKPTEVAKFMRSADLLIHVSLAEGLSTVLLESMACGLPFVTTPAGGNGYLAEDSDAGIVTPFEDETILASNILDLINNKSRLQQTSSNGISYSKNLHWDEVFNKIMKIYENLLELRRIE
jgi:glycosyltransferase involved in cell wall biosynthesis